MENSLSKIEEMFERNKDKPSALVKMMIVIELASLCDAVRNGAPKERTDDYIIRLTELINYRFASCVVTDVFAIQKRTGAPLDHVLHANQRFACDEAPRLENQAHNILEALMRDFPTRKDTSR